MTDDQETRWILTKIRDLRLDDVPCEDLKRGAVVYHRATGHRGVIDFLTVGVVTVVWSWGDREAISSLRWEHFIWGIENA